MAEQITSRANPLCVHLRKLASSRAYREESGEFLCDSPKLLQEAIRWGAEIQAVSYTAGANLPDLPPGTRLAEVSESVMRAVSPVQTPQGAVFSCRLRPAGLPETLERGRYLVLDGVQDPGNVGTILRTADAFGCAGAFLLPGCADLYHPRTLRAAMGVHFRAPLWRCALPELTERLRAADLTLWAAGLEEGAMDVREVDLSAGAVVIGSEGRGISREVLAACGGVLTIPMSGRCESLNAAAAAAVLLWEGWRRNACG